MKKIGIIGGTFDPIHIGHIEMARAAKKRFSLDSVIFIPGGNTPHKDARSVTPAKTRLDMVKAAVGDEFPVCGYEVEKESYSYTSDTLEHFKRKSPEDELYFIVGADSLDYMDHWHEPEVIFADAAIIAFGRDDFNVRQKAKSLDEKFFGKILFANDKICDISSTKIRLFADMELDFRNYVPDAVYDFIKKNHMYEGYFSDMRKRAAEYEKESRFIHTLGVCKMAVKMAQIFGEDIKKTYTAALLHDIAKNIPDDEMYETCEKYGVELCDFEKKNPQVVHAKLGAYLAERDFNITDKEILDAIKWHTLGRCDMTRLEKIIFVADMAEEGRSFDGVENIRKAAFSDLDRAVLECITQTIDFNTSLGRSVYEGTYIIRDSLLKKLL